VRTPRSQGPDTFKEGILQGPDTFTEGILQGFLYTFPQNTQVFPHHCGKQ